MSLAKCPYEDNILKDRRLFFIFATLSVLMPALSLSGILKPTGEPLGVWFQRSGAITVVFSVFAELKASNMLGIFQPSGFVNQTFYTTRDKYIKQVKIYNVIALFLIVFGTVTWGYGDLLLNMT